MAPDDREDDESEPRIRPDTRETPEDTDHPEAEEPRLDGLREMVHELASRVESMQQTLDVHQERMDRVNASQAVFEREIAELMQDHRGVIADLRGRHRSTRRRIDMLFEALEEGMAETDATVRDAIRDIRDQITVDHDAGGDVIADEMDLLRDKIERLEERKATAERLHASEGREVERVELLTEAVKDTRERLERVERAVEESRDGGRGTPTVID